MIWVRGDFGINAEARTVLAEGEEIPIPKIKSIFIFQLREDNN